MINWEGRCCQGMKIYGRERGCSILGTKGSILIDRDGYELYDWNGKKTDEFKTGKQTSSTDTIGRDSMTDAHFLNLINGIRHGDKLNSPIPIANVSVTMLQLSNIAYFTKHELTIDPKTGHVTQWRRSHEALGPHLRKGLGSKENLTDHHLHKKGRPIGRPFRCLFLCCLTAPEQPAADAH